jgi:hypothetical protein
LLLAITSLSVSAAPADTVKIKVTTVQLDNQQMGKGIALFKQLVDERLAGKVELMTYTGGQLYSNAEELEAIKNGDIEMCFAVGSTMTTLDPTMSISNCLICSRMQMVAYAIMVVRSVKISWQISTNRGSMFWVRFLQVRSSSPIQVILSKCQQIFRD